MTASYVGCARALERAGAPIGAAESHGLLCGMLCGLDEGVPERWLDEVLGTVPATSADVGECRDVLSQLLVETARALYSDDCRFEPFLPEDGEPLGARTDALAAWCAGFLYGIGTGGEDVERRLSAEALEMLSDLSEVARLGGAGEDDEESEAHYAELIEYMRVGVMLIFEELRNGPEKARGVARRH